MPPKRSKNSSDTGGKSKEQQYYCHVTNEKFYVSTVTLSQIKKAAKTGVTPKSTTNKKSFVRIPSLAEREKCYADASRAIAILEEQNLPSYGGRSWKVDVTLKEPKVSGKKKTPLFRWFRGQLEIACLPHYLERVPDPPFKLKGKTMRVSEEEKDEQLKDISAFDLQYRTSSQISEIAWNDTNHVIPTISQIKFTSPNHELFYSRKQAWEHSAKLIENQVLLDKVLLGYGSRGQMLKPFKPTKAQGLQVGKQRFLRDGLWVIGQEEAWQDKRIQELQEEEERIKQQRIEREQRKKEEEEIRRREEEHEIEEESDDDDDEDDDTIGLQYYVDSRLEGYHAKKLMILQTLEHFQNESQKRQDSATELQSSQTGTMDDNPSPTRAIKEQLISSLTSYALQTKENNNTTIAIEKNIEQKQEQEQEQKHLDHELTDVVTNGDCNTKRSRRRHTKPNRFSDDDYYNLSGTHSNNSQSQMNNCVTIKSTPATTIATWIDSTQQEQEQKPTYEIKDAEIDLQNVWRTLTKDEQDLWISKARLQKLEEKLKYLVGGTSSRGPLDYFLRCRKHKYHEERLKELGLDEEETEEGGGSDINDSDQEKDGGDDEEMDEAEEEDEGDDEEESIQNFTLGDATNELRDIWRDMTDKDKNKWKKRYQRDREEFRKITKQKENGSNDEHEDNNSNGSNTSSVAGITIKGGSNKQGGLVSPGSHVHSIEIAKTQPAILNLEAATSSTPATVNGSAPSGHCSAPAKENSLLAKSSTIYNQKEEDVKVVSPSPTNTEEEPLNSTKSASSGEVPVDSTNKPKSPSTAITKTMAVQNQSEMSSSCPPSQPRRITQSSYYNMKPKQIELCYDAALEHYHKVMHTVKSRELSRELADGFDVFRERGRGRFDMELPKFDEQQFDFLTDITKSPWMPVVREILGNDVMLIHKGCFLSMPGSATQIYHQDGPHLTTKCQRPCHAVNVFVPLVDLHLRNGPTEFCLGTHILGHDEYTKETSFIPQVTAGTPIIFDYRLGHRGLGNSTSTCRPLVYCTYAAKNDGKEFRDSVNFSRKRYHKIGDDLLDLPLSREERAKKRQRSLVGI